MLPPVGLFISLQGNIKWYKVRSVQCFSQGRMSAATNERGPQRVRFFDWLIKEINSGSYDGLCWLDKNRTTFRIPWKHNSRKSLVANDYKIFQAWAVISGKYVEASPEPTKWKTNFRCALKSTKRFQLVSESKDPDPHHVYRIHPHITTAANPPADTTLSDHRSDHEDDQLHVSPYSDGLSTLYQPRHQTQEIDVAFETLSLGNPVPVPNGNTSENFYRCSHSDAVQWPVHHLPPDKRPSPNPGEIQQVTWVLNPLGGSDNPIGENPYNNCVIQNVFMNDETEGYQLETNNPTRNGCWLPVTEHAVIQQDMFVPPAVPLPADQPLLIAPLQNNAEMSPLNLDVSIYYRGKLLDEGHVGASRCIFAKDNHLDSTLEGAQLVKFPNPDTLPDRKQARLTSTLLESACLWLYQKNKKIYAIRSGRCKVFLAFSKQLENMEQPPQSRLLPRDKETEIFNYIKFFQELNDFRMNRGGSSPDYTIYLCFGQCFSTAKSKESKLILVKLVPELCKSCHEQAQKEGASSLSEDMSLQISNSLCDMIEEYLSSYNMQE
ncbi:hypothetical protein lerEdw1_005225 [Lerista edwardsae]|nr:hypothetical protein lerEdw1_005225 [Lerista edwardsae]